MTDSISSSIPHLPPPPPVSPALDPSGEIRAYETGQMPESEFEFEFASTTSKGFESSDASEGGEEGGEEGEREREGEGEGTVGLGGGAFYHR